MAAKKAVKKASAKKAVKKASAKKAVKTTSTKAVPKNAGTTWNVQVSGRALVRGRFEVQATSEEQAWELAIDRINYDGLSMDQLKFFEIRLDDEPDEVWEKQ